MLGRLQPETQLSSARFSAFHDCVGDAMRWAIHPNPVPATRRACTAERGGLARQRLRIRGSDPEVAGFVVDPLACQAFEFQAGAIGLAYPQRCLTRSPGRGILWSAGCALWMQHWALVVWPRIDHSPLTE